MSEGIREGFAAAISGWMLVSGFDAVTERIEECARWVEANGGLAACTEAEKKTMEFMVQVQFARADDEGISLLHDPSS